MLVTTYNSESVVLLNDEPDWNDSITLEASTVTRKTRSLAGRESRRALGESLRLSLNWSATLNRTQQNALRDTAQAAEDKPILCPVWPLKNAGTSWASAPYSSGLEIGWMSDWSSYAIGAPLPSPASWDFVAPLLRGSLDNNPKPSLASAASASVTFNFTENSDAEYALVPDPVTFTNGVALADGSTPKIFPFDKTWQRDPVSGGAEFEIEREQIGPSRKQASAYYTQVAERPLTASLLFVGETEIATFLRWLLDRKISVEAHYVTAPSLVSTLSANASAGTNTITLADAADLGTNRWLALTDGLVTEIVRVTGIAGNVCTLSANLAQTWLASVTMVNLAILARHATDTVRLEFSNPTLAETRIAWREVSGEYSVAVGETRGTTLGTLTTKAWLYQFTLDWNGATEIHRVTSYEKQLTASSQTWTPRPIEHGQLRQNIALDRDEITLKTRWWDGCPFRKFLPNALDCKITLAIFECDVSGANGSNVTQWFGGELTRMSSADGPIITVTAAGANALFDRPALKFLLQPGCNDELFGPWCGLSRAAWTIGATVHAVSGKVVTLKTFVHPGSAPAGFGFAHWFALGYIERTISGVIHRHTVFDSAAIDGSSRIAVTLGSTASPAIAVNDTLNIIPGCDNRPETCKAYHATTNPTGKFNNYARFAGLPFMPDKAPGFTPIKQSDSAAGKK